MTLQSFSQEFEADNFSDYPKYDYATRDDKRNTEQVHIRVLVLQDQEWA